MIKIKLTLARLERTYDNIMANDMNIVLGDFNPKEDHFSRTIGKRSFLAVTNNNDMRLVSFAVTFNPIHHVLCDPATFWE